MNRKTFQPNKIISYFRVEWLTLTFVTLSGLCYNIGQILTPWFEGEMAQCLTDILGGNKGFESMAILVIAYFATVFFVQVARFFKRFYVRRFANNVNRRMKGVLYANLVRLSRETLKKEGTGELLTKAISDVDDCSKGMRKFTTEIFDTCVALIGYVVMLFAYDWRLALISLIFTPATYLFAGWMKKTIQCAGAEYKKVSSNLNEATLDRAENAVTYRIYGCEKVREELYEETLSKYEKAAVRSNIWQTALPPLYLAISCTGVLFILWFGTKNVLGTGWSVWNIAAFTTFLSCFTKLTVKSSKVAKLFNLVQKAEVSWRRIKPLMKTQYKLEPIEIPAIKKITINSLSFAYDNECIFSNLSLTAEVGDIIGITGEVACGKSALGKVFLCESPYTGSIRFDFRELSKLTPREISSTVGYLGHDTELYSDTVKNNVLCGSDEDIMPYLDKTALKDEVLSMEDGIETVIGNNGIRLSGGQAQRLALARTLAHSRPIMVLDDPFSALDRKTEDIIFENLRDYAKDKIIFLISHRLYHFPQMQKIVFIEKGKTFVGTHDELIKSMPTYKKLYDSQTGGNSDEKECN